MRKTVLLGDIADINMGQSPKSEFYNKDGEGLPFMQGVRTFGRVYPKIDTWCTKPTKTADKGDVLFSVRAPVGDLNFAPEYMCIGRGLASLKSRNNRFLYYLLEANKERLISSQTGSIFGSVNAAILKNFKVTIPEDAEEQDKIADILGAIDEKIELNRRMNETLEQMGQALFRHYFIENPEAENWGDGIISDLVNIYSGYAFKRTDFDPDGKYGLVTIKNVQDGSFLPECSDHLSEVPAKAPGYIHLKTGDVLLSLTGNVGRVCISYGKNLLLNQRVAKLAGIDGRHSFAYFMFRQNEFKDKLISMSRGTAQLNLSPVETKKIRIKLPPEDVIEVFYGKAETLFEAITENYQQIQSLITLRDTLLPRLISGKIKV